MKREEEDLILDMCDGDSALSKKAFTIFFEKHGVALQGAIRNKLRRYHLHEENLEQAVKCILNELAVILLGKARNGTLLEVESLTKYAYGVAKKCILQYFDNEKRFNNRLLFYDIWNDGDKFLANKGIDPTAIEGVEIAIADCMQKLSEKENSYIQFLVDSPEDPPKPGKIAKWCGVSPESVRNRLSSARSKLLECLRKKGINMQPYLKEAKR